MDKFKQYLQQKADELDDDVPSQKVWNHIAKNLHPLQKDLLTVADKPTQKKGLVIKLAKWAAAACIFALAGIGLWHLISDKNVVNQNVAQITTTESNETPNTSKTEEAITEIDTPFNKLNFARGIENFVVKNVEPKKERIVSKPAYTSPLTAAQKDEINSVENNFNTVITLAKNKIANTPIYGESASFYNDFIDKFKQMEKDEKIVKKEITQFGLNDMLLDQLINIYQQKLNVLKLLQSEINKTNIRFKQNRNAVDTLKANYLEI
jgi:hypothetical protein